MALKGTLTKTEYDALNEAVRTHYAEKDGKYVLSVEGMVPESEHNDVKTKLVEFRDNNRTLHNENEKLKPIKEALDKAGITDITAHVTEFGELKKLKDKGVGTPNDLDAAIAKAMKPLQDSLAAEQLARKTAEETASSSRFRELVSAGASKHGAKTSALDYIVNDARSTFELVDGALKPKSGAKHPTDPLKDLTPEVWFEHLAKEKDFLFGESSGGGATNTGRPTGGKPNARILVNPTPLEMGQHMKEIASGEIVVQRTAQ